MERLVLNLNEIQADLPLIRVNLPLAVILLKHLHLCEKHTLKSQEASFSEKTKSLGISWRWVSGWMDK